MDIIINSYHPMIVEFYSWNILIKYQKFFTFEIRSAFLFEICFHMKFLYVVFDFLFPFVEFFFSSSFVISKSFYRQWNKLISISFSFQVSASDPDCGVNAMVNYTLGDGFKKMTEFEIKHTTGDVCISGNLDFETRSSYEFPVIATDQGNCRLSIVRFWDIETKTKIKKKQQKNTNTQNITNRWRKK